MAQKSLERGLTLAELMVVVIIVGVLSTLAVTQFGSSREMAFEKEAMANLKLIAAAEKIYRIELERYANATDNSQVNQILKLMIPVSSTKWTYKVTGASATQFCAQANKTSPTTVISIRQNEEDAVKGTNCPP